MKFTLFIIFLFCSFQSYAQHPPKKGPYTSPDGITYQVGDTIYFMGGTKADGSYEHIGKSHFNHIYNKWIHTDLSADFTGKYMTIKFFRTFTYNNVDQETRRVSLGIKTNAATNTDYFIDLVEATRAGEIRHVAGNKQEKKKKDRK